MLEREREREEIKSFVMLVEPFLQPNYVMSRVLGVELLVL